MENKYLLFIVEGKNDEIELQAILHSSYFKKYNKKYKIKFYITNGDISSNSENSTNNILRIIEDIVDDFRRKNYNVDKSDIQEIIQITDLDGAFIPKNCIKKGDDPKYIYSDNCIITSNVDGLWGRNRKKSDILEKLAYTNTIAGIPYSIYYVSCNMDHLLFDQRELSRVEKNRKAYEFGEECERNEEILKQNIFNEQINVKGPYLDSWQFISENTRSLHRHTNINLFFNGQTKNRK